MRKAISILVLLSILGLTLVQVGCDKDEDSPVTLPEECSITLNEIHEWDWWYTGSEINIRWEWRTGDNVKIELFKGNGLAGTITPSTDNDGYFGWPSSTTFGQESGEDYSFKVTNLGDSACSDQTGFFGLIDVSNCYIKFPWTISDPPDTHRAGNEFKISWTSQYTSGTVDLELWYEPFSQLGTLIGVIAEELTITGPDMSYVWTVDSFHNGTSEGYRFKIRDVAHPLCGDISPPFTIIDEDICSIMVLGIYEPKYTHDEIIPISFIFENSSGFVDLRLYSGAIPVTGGLIVENFDSQNGNAVFDWAVTDFGHTGPSFSVFNIRAWDSNDEYCVGRSSNFEIAQ